jgi:hypothetical protein
VTSSLQRLHRGLLAVLVLSLVVAMGPCLTCAQMADDDCCTSQGTSIGAACCVNDGSATPSVSSATALVFSPAPAVAHPVVIDEGVSASLPTFRVPTRPAVAHAILRI